MSNRAPYEFLSSHRFILALLAFSFCVNSVTAQLRQEPIQRKDPVQRRVQKPNARIQSTTPLSLPFWDDFSFTPIDDNSELSNYPLDSIWTNSNSVWVNLGIGLQAPTLKVATFDGLDSLGLPYSDVNLAAGFRDSLTSQRIKMTEVLPADRNTVFLSFFYQCRGNGEPPDENDYLRLSFKNNLGIWEKALEIRPNASLDPKEFYQMIIQIKDPKYFHDGFQFRFENYGRKSGPYDTWNLDYIYLNQFRTLSSDGYPDQALASQSSKLFGDYYSIPVDHFFATLPIDTVEFDVKNMRAVFTGETTGYDVLGVYRNYKDGILTEKKDSLVNNAGVNGGLGTGLLLPYERVRVRMDTIPDASDPAYFNPGADSIDVTYVFHVISGDDKKPDPLFAPIDFRVNDTLETTYRLNNYYAYDDGTAEYSALLSTSGDTLAYAFDMATDQYDTLIGFDIYVAPYSLAGNKLADFFIYDDNNGIPGERIYNRFSYTIQKTKVNEFQRILLEPVRLKDRFYIGYRGTGFKVGLDYSNDSGDKMFNNTNGVWFQNTIVHSSLMIRPIFGKGVDGGNGPVGIPEERQPISLYPNPNHGTFRLDNRTQLLQAITLTGQSISFDREVNGEEQLIHLHNPSPGLYILKLQQGKTIRTEKILVR